MIVIFNLMRLIMQKICLNIYYLHITFSVFCTLTSSTHYTQIFAKSSTWECECCLIWPSLIAYELMCKYNFFFFLILVVNLKNNVFRSLKSLFSTSWLILIFAFKRYHVFKTFLDHVHKHWASKTALKLHCFFYIKSPDF